MDNSKLVLIPHAVIHPSKIVLYKEVNWQGVHSSLKFAIEKSEAQKFNQSKFLNSSRKNNGFLSDHALSKLSRAIEYFIFMATEKRVFSHLQNKYIKFRVVFVTLTLPSAQIHSDKKITNKCLNQLLIELERYHNIKRYIWRAEKQGNGNIHYHLLMNEFIDYQILRKRWNRICNKLGYVDTYQKKMTEFFANGFRLSANPNDLRSPEDQRKAFIIGQRSNWTSPNSTDIHNTKKIKNIQAYISKYLKKQAQVNLDEIDEESDKLLVNGRLWSCSHDLSNIKGCNLVEDWELSDLIQELAEKTKSKFYHDTYFSVLFADIREASRLGLSKLTSYFASYLADTFNFNLQLSF